MLKKLRQKFILSALLSFGLVMLVLIAGINLLNYQAARRGQERVIDGILDYELAPKNEPRRRPINEMPWAGGPGSEFTSRFFVVRCDQSGELKTFGHEFINSVDEETAGSYARQALDAGRSAGRIGNYRYRVSENGDELILVFLNIQAEKKQQSKLLLASALIGFCSFACVTLLVLLLSKPAMRPYMKNIERQKQFITDAGHELKTPITSITTSADIAAMEYEGDEWIANIQTQAARLTRLVNDLVTLSRLDEETPFPEPTRFSLSEAAWETAESFQARAKAEGKDFQTEIGENIELLGDRASVQKLTSILLDNAFKYSEPDGQVRLCVQQKNAKALIEVANTCNQTIPVDPERLFDRFYRLDGSRSAETGGTGLGLSIAKAIAESHRGELAVSTDEPGTIRFQASLPISSRF